MAKKYQLKQRAEKQEETRKRIVGATLELHGKLGPAHTSIKAIAKRAGVERPTVYRHFPTLDDLFHACSSLHWTENPLPDPEAMAAHRRPGVANAARPDRTLRLLHAA
jgi:AcrR family transcriptional regulator